MDKFQGESRTSIPAPHEFGGARRDRTDDLLLAKQALSQLSYGPSGTQNSEHEVARTPALKRLGSKALGKCGGPGKI